MNRGNFSFSNSGYESRNRFQPQNQYGYSRNSRFAQPQQHKKMNAAKLGVTTKGQNKGQPCITAWNYSKGKGLITFVATPSRKHTKTFTSKNNPANKFRLYAVKMFVKRTLQESVFFALYNETTGKLIMDKIGMVADVRNRYCVTIKR